MGEANYNFIDYMEDLEFEIYSFNMAKIVGYGKKIRKENLIYCDEDTLKLCYVDKSSPTIKKSSSHITYQLLKYYEKENMKQVLASFDFSDCYDIEYNALRSAVNGIKLVIDGKEIIFKEFLKSSSMSRSAKMLYINANDKDKYVEIVNRITLTPVEYLPKIIISKWFAYSGLVVSDCEMFDEELNEENVIIIPDKETISKVKRANTSISIRSLIQLVDKYKKGKTKSNDFRNVIRAYAESKTIKEIGEKKNYKNYYEKEIVAFVNDLYDITLTSIDEDLAINLDKLKEKPYYKPFEQNQPDSKAIDRNVHWLNIDVEDFYIKVNHFDGEGLIDENLARKINYEYFARRINKANDKDKEYKLNKLKDDIENHFEYAKFAKSFQLRLPYVKGMIHTTNIQQFIKDHNIASIKGFNGNNELVEYKDLSKIKMILTESQFKGMKYLDSMHKFAISLGICKEEDSKIKAYFALLKHFDYKLGLKIEKHNEKLSHFNYQFWSTLPLNNVKLDKVYKLNEDNFTKQCSKESLLREYLYSINLAKLKNKDSYYKNDYLMYKDYPDFYESTKRYKNEIEKKFESFRNEQLVGRNYVYAYRKYLSADLLSFLYYAFFRDSKKTINHNEYLKKYEIYIPNTNRLTKYDGELILLRNPHYSRSEIAILKNLACKHNAKRTPSSITTRRKYFKYLNNVVFINPESLTLQRLGGSDTDGDTILVVYQYDIIKKVKYNILEVNHNEDKSRKISSYILSVPIIPSIEANNQALNHDNIIVCLSNTFSNRVGQISNMAFHDTHQYYKDNIIDNDKIAEYTILGGLEIDSAKTGSFPFLPKTRTNKELENNFEYTFTKKIKDINEDEVYYKPKISDIRKLLKENSFDEYKGVALYNIVNHYAYFKNPKTEDKNIDISKIKTNGTLKGKYYALIIDILHTDLTNKYFNYDNTEDKKTKVLEKMTKIKNLSISEIMPIINKFRKKDPILAFNDYCFDKYPFHFMELDRQKESWLDKNEYSLSNDQKEKIFDFKNEGFCFVYLILYYLKKEYELTKFENDLSSRTIKKWKTNLKETVISNVLIEKKMLEEELLKEVLKYEKEIFEDIVNTKDKESFYNVFNSYIKKKGWLKFIKFDDIIEIYKDVKQTVLIFNIYFDITYNYLGGTKLCLRK